MSYDKKQQELIRQTMYGLIKKLHPDAIRSKVIIQEDGPDSIHVKCNVQIMQMPKDVDISIAFTNED